MKILHIIDNLYPGGAQTFVVMLANEQSTAGHAVSLLVIDKLTNSNFEKNLTRKLSKSTVKIISSNRRLGKNISIFKSVFNILRVIKKTEFDIINTHLQMSHLIVGILLKPSFLRKKNKQVITLHNAPEVWSRANMFINKTKPSIYCSNASLNTCSYRNCKKIVIENGIAIPSVSNKAEQLVLQAGIKEGNKIVLCVGKLSKQKNYNLVLQIAGRYLNNGVSFIILGLPADTSELDQIAFKRLSNIHYLGILPQDDIHSLMNKCDCFLNTSIYEGLPITVLEAFFIGAPCLLSPIPPHYEIGAKMPFCYIPSVFDLNSFTEKLDQVLSLDVQREQVLKARSKFLKHFEISNTSNRYIKFYNGIIEDRAEVLQK